MDKSIHEVRLMNWKSIVEQCNSRPQGQSIKQWLAEQGIPEKTYYYWQRKVRREVYDQMKQASLPAVTDKAEVAFAELPVQQYSDREPAEENTFRPDAVIQSGKFTINLSNSASKPLITKILEAASRVS